MRRAWQPKTPQFRRTAEPAPNPTTLPIVTRFTGREDQKIRVVGYMCAIDWEHEIGNAHDGNTVYPSVSALKAHHDCWEECGIVEVEVIIRKTIAPQKY